MFCKFCGKGIPDGAAFCPECGKSLKTIEIQAQKPDSASCLPFVLMLLLLCVDTVCQWGRILFSRATTGLETVTLIETASLVIGLLLLGILVFLGKIRMNVYSFADLPVMICAGAGFPLLSTLGTFLMKNYYGQNGLLAGAAFQPVMKAIQLMPFWMALGLAWMGVERTGRWHPTNRQKLILYLAPLVCVPLGILCSHFLLVSVYVVEEVFPHVQQAVCIASLFCWLEPLMLQMIFRRLGMGQVSRIGAIAAFLGSLVGECLLLFFVIVCMRSIFLIGGVYLGALLSLPILLLASYLHTRWARKA